MEKKDIFIVIVCLLLLFLWFAKSSSTKPRVPYQDKNIEVTEPSPSQQKTIDQSESKSVIQSSSLDSDDRVQPRDESLTAAASMYAEIPASLPITLTSEGITDFKIDPEKGGVVEVVIHEHMDKDGKHKMSIGQEDFLLFNTQNSSGSWEFSHAKIESVDPNKHLTISRAILGTELILEQSWSINQDIPYDLDYSFTLKNLGHDNISIDDIKISCGIMPPLSSTKGFMGAGGIDQRIDALLSGNSSPKTIAIEKISDYSDHDREKIKQWQVDWLAVQNKYFVSLISGETPFSGCNLLTIDENKGPVSTKNQSKNLAAYVYLPNAEIDAGKSYTWRFDCYTGPKKYDILKKLGRNEESILQFDLFLLFHFNWMKGISLGILWCLNKLESVFHNYGVAIIFITLFIRIIFWPITHQTTIWSKKMQRIQPLAQEIREKYKKDPQKMQQKTMELYREQKINPIAGCLPMVLQIPVFFALFNVLRSAIELRQAQFLWAVDLSEQDSIFTIPGIDIPINPLAIIMGLTMVWQQKIVPTSVDPMQQKVMMFMTSFFVLILYSMPSGLTLYWSINQIVSIFQHKITRRIDGEPKKEK